MTPSEAAVCGMSCMIPMAPERLVHSVETVSYTHLMGYLYLKDDFERVVSLTKLGVKLLGIEI